MESMGDTRALGRYEVVRHLASGGMAQVLLARARGIEGFERYVVIKQIHVERARDENVVKMFLDEARLAATLHHTNIVQVHDIGQEAGEYFFAMEYVHGQDVRMLLRECNRRREKVPWEHVVTIMTSDNRRLTVTDQHPMLVALGTLALKSRNAPRQELTISSSPAPRSMDVRRLAVPAITSKGFLSKTYS